MDQIQDVILEKAYELVKRECYIFWNTLGNYTDIKISEDENEVKPLRQPASNACGPF